MNVIIIIITIIIIIACSSVRVIIITSPYTYLNIHTSRTLLIYTIVYAYTVVSTLYLSVTSRAPSTTLAPTATSTSPTVAPTGAVTLTSIYTYIHVRT